MVPQERPLMPGPDIRYRSGSSGDVPAIAALLVRSWRSAYRGFLPPEFLEALSVDKQARRHGDAIAKGARYAVALNGSSLAGFASWGPRRFETIPADGELYTIYVDPAAIGHGIGSELLRLALDDLSRIGKSVGVLVMKRNPFRGFYDKRGFQPVSECAMDLGGFSETNVVYVYRYPT
jgi:ribosomal protein S18 acetylase RimI-like enzyme